MTLQKRKERFRSELKAETLVAARELIQEEGYDGLTIRKLAARLGCSPMALYSYFADKQALLTALALEGFERVASRLHATVDSDPIATVRKLLQTSIAYAEEKPFEYRVLFMSVETLGELKLTREDLQERNPAFQPLFRGVQACIEAGVFRGDAFALTTILWTGAHGAASVLVTATHFPFTHRKSYITEVVELLLSGAQAHETEGI